METISTNKTRGFTLIELLAAVAIITILTALSVFALGKFNKSEALDLDASTIAETLRQARSLTQASKNSNQYGVHFASSTITMFVGPTYSSGASTNQTFALQTTDIIVDLNLNNGATDVLFNRLTGETGQDGTVIITASSVSQTKTVTIYKTGVVQYQ